MPKLGRPSKLTPALIAKIAECFFVAFTDQQIADFCDIDRKTIQKIRAGSLFPEIKKAELERERKYRLRIWDGLANWCGAAWFLERKYPEQFAKPEIQLGFQSSYTQNNLSVQITSGDAKTIEAEAKPIRTKIEEVFKQYRPQPNGNE